MIEDAIPLDPRTDSGLISAADAGFYFGEQRVWLGRLDSACGLGVLELSIADMVSLPRGVICSYHETGDCISMVRHPRDVSPWPV